MMKFLIHTLSIALFLSTVSFSAPGGDDEEDASHASHVSYLTQAQASTQSGEDNPHKRKQVDETEEDSGALVESSSNSDTSFDDGSFPQPGQHPRKKVRRDAAPTAAAAPARATPRPSPLYAKFQRIIESEPAPLEPMKRITAQEEQAHGSRRFVKKMIGFQTQRSGDAWHAYCESWHTKSLEAVEAMSKALGPHHLNLSKNIALARITFFNCGNNQFKSEEIPFFFISGWPSRVDKTTPLPNFAKSLSKGGTKDGIKGLDTQYKDHGLKTITMTFKGESEPDTDNSEDREQFFETLNSIFNKEKESNDRLLGDERLQHHHKMTIGEGVEDQFHIQNLCYFHSEQAMRGVIKDKIRKYRDTKERRQKASIAHYAKHQPPSEDSGEYAIVDIASRYDMCWCCGDTLCSESHIKEYGMPCFFQVSGGTAYADQPFDVKDPLRNYRRDFTSYNSNEAFSKDPYQTYIAHMAKSDFRTSSAGAAS